MSDSRQPHPASRRGTVAEVEHERTETGTERITIRSAREDTPPIVLALRAGDPAEACASALERTASALRAVSAGTIPPQSGAREPASHRRQRKAYLIATTCPLCRAHRLVSDGQIVWCSDVGTRRRAACSYGKTEPIPAVECLSC